MTNPVFGDKMIKSIEEIVARIIAADACYVHEQMRSAATVGEVRALIDALRNVPPCAE